jgi:hypothetical protein
MPKVEIFRIDKEIPIPGFGSDSPIHTTMKAMAVGDSFFLAGAKPSQMINCARLVRIRIKTRTEKSGTATGLRIWRVE